MKSLKKLAAIGLSTALAFSLAACKDDETSSEGKGGDKNVTLDFWTFGATNYEDLAKEYEKQNPGVKIKVRAAETAEHHDALFTALSAGRTAGRYDFFICEGRSGE